MVISMNLLPPEFVGGVSPNKVYTPRRFIALDAQSRNSASFLTLLRVFTEGFNSTFTLLLPKIAP
jgi:hypothetical protein